MDAVQRLTLALTYLVREGHNDTGIRAIVDERLAHLRDVLPKEQGGSRVDLHGRSRARAGVLGTGKRLAGSLTVTKPTTTEPK